MFLTTAWESTLSQNNKCNEITAHALYFIPTRVKNSSSWTICVGRAVGQHELSPMGWVGPETCLPGDEVGLLDAVIRTPTLVVGPAVF